MSMEHKAFLFDTNKYHEQIEPIIEKCCKTNNTSEVRAYINENYEQIANPYTGDVLDVNWENELESGSMQELFDFALAGCYAPDDDIGLGYAWDGVLEAIKEMHVVEDAEICVLGNSLIYAGVEVNPGLMGLGLVEANDVVRIKDMLLINQEKLESMEFSEDVLYELEQDELMDAYDDLCTIYESAEREGKGILFTF